MNEPGSTRQQCEILSYLEQCVAHYENQVGAFHEALARKGIGLHELEETMDQVFAEQQLGVDLRAKIELIRLLHLTPTESRQPKPSAAILMERILAGLCKKETRLMKKIKREQSWTWYMGAGTDTEEEWA